MTDLRSPVAIAHGGRLASEVEGLADGRRGQHVERLPVLLIERVDGGAGFPLTQSAFELLLQGAPAVQPPWIDFRRRLQRLLIELLLRRLGHAGGEVFIARCAARCKGSILSAEPAADK